MATALDDEHMDRLAKRAAAPLSAQPRPFVRWAGSKRGLLTHILPHLPKQYGRYFEPFLGSGALYFLLEPESAFINDSSPELVATYAAVRQDAGRVGERASQYPMEKTAYYRIRESRSSDPIERAAEFLFLNRACFNGLYRVNGSGKFNVPWGAPKTSFIVDTRNLVACGKQLSRDGQVLTSTDFEQTLERCEAGDLVFLDPPYVTKHNENGFVDYNERLFSWADQLRLARVADELRAKGCHVIVTNANHSDLLSLYEAFDKHEILRSSTLAGAASKRGKVSEIVLVSRS